MKRLVLAVVAIFISVATPLVQFAYRIMQKPHLEIIPFDIQPLTIGFDLYGARLSFCFSVLSRNDYCVVKSIAIQISRMNEGLLYSSKWFQLKPIQASWMLAGVQQATLNSAALVHPVKVEAEKLEPLNVEFMAHKEAVHQSVVGGVFDSVDGACFGCSCVDDVLSDQTVLRSIKELAELCPWSAGKYVAMLTMYYDADESIIQKYSFSIDENQANALRTNAAVLATMRIPADVPGVRRQLQSFSVDVKSVR